MRAVQHYWSASKRQQRDPISQCRYEEGLQTQQTQSIYSVELTARDYVCLLHELPESIAAIESAEGTAIVSQISAVTQLATTKCRRQVTS